MRIHRLTAPAAALLALGLAACGSDEGDRSEEAGAPIEVTTESPTESPAAEDPAGDDTATAEDSQSTEDSGDQTEPESDTGSGDQETPVLAAIALAEAEVGGIAHEVDEDDGRWEIDVALDGESIEVAVDAAGTEVLGTSSDSRISAGDLEALDEAVVSIAEAIEIALAEAPGEIEDVDLDTRDGRYVWDVEIETTSDDVSIEIDILTGEILEIDS